ncbi:hypothetical protein SDC9_191002 [bioreactor metagenome]|uniref:Uncharacterized protein n=1 Tax=bioreactor metagenome TaxID=1076179 RepID=A0A645HY64_9ZZZZ
MQEPGVDGVIAGHAFHQSSTEHHALGRLRDAYRVHCCQSGNILAGSGGITVQLQGDGLRPGCAAIGAQDLQHALVQGALAIAGGGAVLNEHALIAGIPAEPVPISFLEEPGSPLILTGDFLDEALKPLAAGFRVILDRKHLGQFVFALVLGEGARVQMQGAVFAVDHIGVFVKIA